MDIPKFKDILQKLNVFKDYSALLVPIVITLVAVLLFIPNQLLSSRLKKQIGKESISIGKRIGSLSRNVESRDQWKIEQEYQQAYESDANQVALLGIQSDQRGLLSYRIFPEPEDTSALIFNEFGQKFRVMIDGLLEGINSSDCPTVAELKRSLGVSRTGQRFSGGVSLGSLSEVDMAIMDALCRTKAETSSVYINPLELGGYEFWGEYDYTGTKEVVEDCWYWQLGYWIIEDVIDTIAVVNASSNSVFTSPVKRLMGVSFSRMFSSTAKVYKPKYVLKVRDGLVDPCTNRFYNSDINVVHFNFIVLIDAKAILPFMQELCSAKQHKFRGFSGTATEQKFKHNQITILESKIRSVELNDETHSLYRYGEDAVVELDLICEYVFNKKGYDKIMPESIKEILKAQQ